MTDIELLTNIVMDQAVMTGKPIIKGTRLTVEFILNLLAHGATIEEIRAEYASLTNDDIYACLLFATKALEDTAFLPLTAEADRYIWS